VRQRVTRERLSRRSTTADPVCVNRGLLLTDAEHSSTKQWRRLTTMLGTRDPTQEIGAGWGARKGRADRPNSYAHSSKPTDQDQLQHVPGRPVNPGSDLPGIS